MNSMENPNSTAEKFNLLDTLKNIPGTEAPKGGDLTKALVNELGDMREIMNNNGQ